VVPSAAAWRCGVLDVLARVQAKLVEPDYPGAFRYLAGRNRSAP